jgi:GWxTD domain-containing protein
MRLTTKLLLGTLLTTGLLIPSAAKAQDPNQDDTKNQKAAQKDKKRSNKALYNELDDQYKRWLNEDVIYIITPEERQAFLRLSTNEEREVFIENFWLRRDPTPDSPENEFKEEHYRRIAYANERFSSGIPGWKSDRGRIYIMWGKPDQIETHAQGGSYQRPSNEGGGETSTYAFETWRYRYLEGVGQEVILEFVDPTGSGEFHMSIDPGEKDALLHIPGMGLTMLEAMGMSSKVDRFSNTDGTTLGKPFGTRMESDSEFSRLLTWAKVQQPPPVKFKDLEAVVTSRILRNQISFDYRLDFFRVTSDTVLVPITVQIPNRQMSFKEKDGVQSATMNLFGRISTLGGRIVQTFEDVINRDVPDALLEQSLKNYSIYQKAVPLRSGLYRLDIVIKDVNSGNVGVVNARLPVPKFEDDKLATSHIVLADEIQRVSSKDIGVGQFVLGDVKIRPKLDAVFTPSDQMGIYMQVYNLKVDEKTHKPDASIEYRVVKDGQKDEPPVMSFEESSDKLGEHGEQLTIEKALLLGKLAPGKYKLQIQITDKLSKETISPSADFTVKPSPK